MIRSGYSPNFASETVRYLFPFLTIAIIVLSVVTTFQGLQEDLGWLVAGLIAVVLAILFAMADFGIKDRKENNQSKVPALLAILLLSLISLVGHFNYLYSRWAGPQIGKTLAETALQNADAEASRAKEFLLSSRPTEARVAELGRKLEGLEREVRELGNSGYGDEASGKFKEVRAVGICLGLPYDTLTEPRGRSSADAEEWVASEVVAPFSEKRTALLAGSAASKFDQQWATTRGELELAYATLDSADIAGGRNYSEFLRKVKLATSSIAASVQSARLSSAELCPSKETEEENFSIDTEKLISPDKGRTGNLAETYASVIEQKQYQGVALMAVLLSMAIDLFPAFMVMIFLGPRRFQGSPAAKPI